jgi:hypothetical protein
LGRRALGFCTLARGEMNVPAEFRYFADPKLGGKELEDYCPIWQVHTHSRAVLDSLVVGIVQLLHK